MTTHVQNKHVFIKSMLVGSVYEYECVTFSIFKIVGNMPHVYYMCNIYEIHVWCFWCITHVINIPVINL